ncbi:DegT/DnrJ/EryC1/StrS family aminotransferase [Candidatus Omnitrophota bacterium]
MIRRRNPRFYKGEWRDILSLIFKGKVAEGDHVNLFEQRFASYIGAKFAIATCSGRNGMELALDALGIGEGKEVIVPAYTLKDLIKLMEKKGISPVLVDVERDSFNIDPVKIESKITSQTRAIIATHIFGVPCDVEKIREIADRHGLKVLEDCAHVAGASFKGKKLGTFGDAAFFSFEMIKPLNTFGGGMVLTNDERLAENIRDRIEGYPAAPWKVLRKIMFLCAENLVIQSPLFPLLIRMFTSNLRASTEAYQKLHSGAKSIQVRYANIQAFVALKQMDELEANNAKRTEASNKLTKMLQENIKLQKVPDEGGRTFYFYVVRTDGKKPIEDVRKDLLSCGVDAGIGEEITDDCSLLSGYGDDYPVTEELYRCNLQLPMYDSLKDEDIALITSTLNKACPTSTGGEKA